MVTGEQYSSDVRAQSGSGSSGVGRVSLNSTGEQFGGKSSVFQDQVLLKDAEDNKERFCVVAATPALAVVMNNFRGNFGSWTGTN